MREAVTQIFAGSHTQLFGGLHDRGQRVQGPRAAKVLRLSADVATAGIHPRPKFRRIVVQRHLRMPQHRQQLGLLLPRFGVAVVQVVVARAGREQAVEVRRQSLRRSDCRLPAEGLELGVVVSELTP